jgi:hypothetical protein
VIQLGALKEPIPTEVLRARASRHAAGLHISLVSPELLLAAREVLRSAENHPVVDVS